MSSAFEQLNGPVAAVFPGQGDTVVKVYPGSLDRETRSALEREQALLSALRHLPSILQVEEITKLADGRTALRMPRCDRSLATLPDSLPVRDVLLIGETVALALAAAHRAGVVHGSITPGNVLIRHTGEPVVADFGVALRQRFSRDPLYDLEYTAPETVHDQTVSERSDLYGLGALLHLMLTGEPPHRTLVGEQPGVRIHRVLTEPVPGIERPDVPDELATLVADLLAKDPADRPANAAAQLTRLRTGAHKIVVPGLPAEPILVLEPTRHERPPEESPRRRRKYGVALAIVAGVCAVAAVPWFLTTTGNDAPSPETGGSSANGVVIDLAPPVDQQTSVELSWTSSADLEFAVIVAEEGRAEPQVIPAEHNTHKKFVIRPGLGYCFQVQGRNPQGAYESQVQSLRGAVCK